MKVLLLVLLFLFSVTSAQAPKQRIAVLQLEADGVSQNESATLTNRLRKELLNTGSFTIVERGEMDEILKEQGFQLSGCTSNECAVEAGRLLNVSQIAAGSIGKVGALYTISLRLIDVQSGEILKNISEDCQCPIERVLTNSMRNAALKLAGRMPYSTGVAVLSEGSGDIFIKTTPGGADIYLDNMQTGKTSPATLQDVAAGNHFIKVVKGQYIGTKSVTVKANDIAVETITLKKAKGGLKIYSSPPEAEIYIDGQNYGKTPKIIKQLSVGDHRLVVKKDSYEDYGKTVQVKFNQFNKVSVTLKKRGAIRIKSNPSNAAIYINGRLYGKSPKTIRNLLSGSYKISLKKDGYIEFESAANVQAEKTTNVSANLIKQAELYIHSEPSAATVFINGEDKGSTPLTLKLAPGKKITVKLVKIQYSDWQKTITLKEGENKRLGSRLEKLKGTLVLTNLLPDAEVTINGKKIKTAPKKLSLPVGKYDLQIAKAGYADKSFSVDLTAGRKKNINAFLEKKTTSAALWRSFALPGWGEIYQEKGGRSLLYGLAYIGSGMGSFLYTQKYNTAVSDYDEIRAAYQAAVDESDINRLRKQMDSKYSAVNAAEKTRNIFYIASASIWLINMLDVLILPPGWGSNARLSAVPQKNGMRFGLSYSW